MNEEIAIEELKTILNHLRTDETRLERLIVCLGYDIAHREMEERIKGKSLVKSKDD
jgi:hypothetical protein